MTLIRQFSLTRQPVGRGLVNNSIPPPVFLWNHASGSAVEQAYNLAPSTEATFTTRVTPAGIGLNPSATGRRYTTEIFEGQTRIAWLVVAHRDATADSTSSVVRKNGACIPVQESAGGVRSAVWNGGGVQIAQYTAPGTITDYYNKICVFGAVVDSSSGKTYLQRSDGFFVETNAASYVGTVSSTADPLCIGGTESGSEIATQWTILSVALWQNLIPSQTQMINLVRSNPWQLFAKRNFLITELLTGAYTLNAETGAYTFTGSNATLLHNYALTLESASYSLTGSNASLLKGLVLDAASGSYTLTGSDATLVYNKLLNASSGSYSVSGADANLIYTPASGAYTLNAESGAYVLTGSDVTFAYSGGIATIKAGSWIRYRIIT